MCERMVVLKPYPTPNAYVTPIVANMVGQRAAKSRAALEKPTADLENHSPNLPAP